MGRRAADAAENDRSRGVVRERVDDELGEAAPDRQFDDDPRVLVPYLKGNLGYAWPPRKLIGIALSHKNQTAPNGRYSYSNTNCLVLGLIVERVTGTSLARALRARIYGPLRLTHTSLQTRAGAGRPRVHGYYVFGKPPAADITALSPYPWASGAVVSTVVPEMQDTVAFAASTNRRLAGSNWV
jgi:CubicO group peptidase (beta-lactamase class C family)